MASFLTCRVDPGGGVLDFFQNVSEKVMETIGTISGGPDETSAEAAAPTGPVEVDHPDVSVGLGVSTDVPAVSVEIVGDERTDERPLGLKIDG